MEKKCELCGSPKVYNINSHYTPRSISESTYGGKDKEYIVTISPHEGIIEEFYGREHPDAVPDVIKPQPNVGKGIFCKRCEDALGKFESECQELLNNAISALAIGELNVFRTGRGVKYFTIPIPSNILRVFYYSVIWRQCLEQKHGGTGISLDPVEFERLRSILNTELHKPLKEVMKSELFKQYPDLLVFTTYHKEPDSGFNNPSPVKSNPEVFYVAQSVCLYWKQGAVTANYGMITNVPNQLLLAKTLLSSGLTESRIAILNQIDFEKVKSTLFNKSAKDFILKHISDVSCYRGISLSEAAKLLEIEAYKLRVDDSPKAYTMSIIAASNKLQEK